LEDAIRFPLRAKVENHENLLVAVLPVVHAVDVEGNTRGEGGFTPDKDDWILDLAVGNRNSIVTIIDGDPSVLDMLRRGVEEKPDRIVEGSRAVHFEIVVEEGVEAIDKGIWDAEKAVLESRSGNVQRQIHKLTGQAVKPLAAALEHLNENGAPVAHRHLCRTRHHVLRVMERCDGSRDLLSSLLYLNLTMVGQKISAWGAILIVPTLIAGVFGMNFTEEWWTRAEHGFEVMIAVMVLVSGFLYLWFRRSGWL